MYDPKCEELARYFLANEDGAWAQHEKTVKSVAQHIQDAVEDAIEDLRPDEEY